jgi:hypothetical protein
VYQTFSEDALSANMVYALSAAEARMSVNLHVTILK